MNRSSKSGKVLYQAAVAGIVLLILTTISATAYIVWFVYRDLTWDYLPEPKVPRINRANYTKVTDILAAKQGGGEIKLETREVKFGREDPFSNP